MFTGSPPTNHLNVGAFDDFIEGHGTTVTWRKARTCPCLDPLTGQARAACPFCRDLPGTIWDAGSPLVCFVPSRQRTDIFDAAGKRIEGVVQVTFDSEVTPGPLDRLELVVAEIVVNNERHIRGERVNGRSTERLRLPPIAVEFVDAIIGYDAIAEVDGELVQYTPGTDLLVAGDGSITWGDTAPPDGASYTVRYRAHPVFVCWSPMSRDEGGVKQPYKSLAQRLEFFRQPSVGE